MWSRVLGVAVLAACSTSAVATPIIGDLPGSATDLTGGGISTITASLDGSDDIDMYKIFLADTTTFSATTFGTAGTLMDTQLFLFDAAGLGVWYNDDVSSNPTLEYRRSTLTGFSGSAGFYYLAISAYNNDPFSVDGLMFPDTLVGVLGPTGPGGGSPISGWTGGGGGTGTYTIDLTGLASTTVPEPSTLSLLLIALLGLAWRRRQRNGQTVRNLGRIPPVAFEDSTTAVGT